MEQPEELRYPVQAVVDLATNFNREHFEYAIAQCRNAISQVLAEDNTSDQQIARVRVLKYVNLQLSRAVRWIDQEADLMALVLRSLIELCFWAHFISQSNDKAKHFLEEANTDSKDIYERLLRAYPEETTPYNFPPVAKRVNLTRIDEKEDLLWKVCSKFIHPTSFVLEAPETTILNEDYRKVFAVKVLYYGWGILEMFHPINWIDWRFSRLNIS
jgi:hypothetical protein